MSSSDGKTSFALVVFVISSFDGSILGSFAIAAASGGVTAPAYVLEPLRREETVGRTMRDEHRKPADMRFLLNLSAMISFVRINKLQTPPVWNECNPQLTH